MIYWYDIRTRPLFFVAFIACCLLIVGCTRTVGTIDIAGKVLDNYNREGVPNRIVILQSMMTSDSGLINANEIGRFYTDSTGQFAYTLRKAKDVYWYNFVFVGDTTYSFASERVSLSEMERNSKFLSFRLDKLTNFTIKIERNNKSSARDTLCISWKTNGFEGRFFPHRVLNFGVAPDFEFRWIGGNVKSLIETKTFANKNTIIHMDIFGKGSIREMSDTIYCERDVKNYFTFKY